MKYELEIEIKNLLTLDEFMQLCHYFQLNEHHFTPQINFYFETQEAELKKRKAVLRIRQKENQFTLTLKQQAKHGIHEYHLTLTHREAQQIIAGEKHSKIQEILGQIQAENLHPQYLGQLETFRAHCSYKDGIIFLDKSNYFQHTDYEVEYEVKNYETGMKDFIQLLKKTHIEIKPVQSKTERFYHQYLKQKR
ncbi:MAG TPA: CYTH domain-containing protein [Firmicutes bacterium]|nr:CYTH domain-containing protein [Bacillales bacterium]HJA40853.1 CYTH domain-containing protein [Bacillota bacterium]